MARKDWNINFKKYLRMHQITLFQEAPSPDPTPSGKGDTPSHTPPLSAPTGLDTPPLSRILDPPLDVADTQHNVLDIILI